MSEEEPQQDSRPLTPEPEVEDKHRKQAARMAAAYQDNRPTTVLPGTDGMISGTAIADWTDESQAPRK